jgi:replicative DNA helicase
MKHNLQEITNRSTRLEKELLSKLDANINNVAIAKQYLTQEDFYAHGTQFSLAVECMEKGKDLTEELVMRGVSMSDFYEVFTTRPVELVCRDILDCANARRVTKVLEESLSVPHENVEKYVAEVQKNLIGSVSSKSHEAGNITQVLKEYKEQQDFYKEKIAKGGIVGISTGYQKLDDVIDGFRPEHLWIIGGYTNMGKTSAALNLVSNLAKQGKRVVIYSLEMSRTDIVSRLLGIMTEDNGLSIVKGYAKHPLAVETAKKTLEDSGMVIYCGKNELSEIQMSMYEESLKKPVDLFVVDFLQIVSVKGAKSEYEMITNSALGFQQMAKKIKSPIVVLSQISNDGARNPDQDVMTFKGSGSIASAADFAIEIVRSGEDKSKWLADLQKGEPVEMKWLIRKNRHGRVGYIDMRFNGRTGIFKPDEIEY